VDDSHTFFWLVGVCEGEAYFGYSKRNTSPVLEVEMKDEHVIARIAALFNVVYARRDRRETRPASSVTYRVKLGGKRALQVMKRLQPYMSPRRARAIQQVEDAYCSEHVANRDYNRIPLPPLVDLPYVVERG
jgi:hypothetical protein